MRKTKPRVKEYCRKYGKIQTYYLNTLSLALNLMCFHPITESTYIIFFFFLVFPHSDPLYPSPYVFSEHLSVKHCNERIIKIRSLPLEISESI